MTIEIGTEFYVLHRGSISKLLGWACLTLSIVIAHSTLSSFPQIDGVNMYKPDQSHMAYSKGGESGPCPSSHPKRLVTIFFGTYFLLLADQKRAYCPMQRCFMTSINLRTIGTSQRIPTLLSSWRTATRLATHTMGTS